MTTQYLSRLAGLLERAEHVNEITFDAVSERFADTLAAGGLVHLFGQFDLIRFAETSRRAEIGDLQIEGGEVRARLPEILAAMDQPSIDGFNTWLVARLAKEEGLKVALSGLGGDELLGSYPSFADVPRWARRAAPPSSRRAT